MRRLLISSLMATLLCTTSGAAQSRSKRPGPAQGEVAITDIRKVDFLNFTYPTTLCSHEYGKQGIGKTVRVSKGEFKNKNVYFAVTEDAILYGDVTGDGQDDAIVPVGCGAIAANFSRSEFYIYTLEEGRLALLAEISDTDLERDYRGYYPDTETYWGVTGNALKIENGNLDIEVLADGPHAAPQYVSTLEYHLSDGRFRPTGKPERTNSSH